MRFQFLSYTNFSLETNKNRKYCFENNIGSGLSMSYLLASYNIKCSWNLRYLQNIYYTHLKLEASSSNHS